MPNGLVLINVKGVVPLVNEGLPLPVVDFAPAIGMNQAEVVV
jgi:hypothetical protein